MRLNSVCECSGDNVFVMIIEVWKRSAKNSTRQERIVANGSSHSLVSWYRSEMLDILFVNEFDVNEVHMHKVPLSPCIAWVQLVTWHSVQMNRSAGFSLGGSYAPHRQLQQQTGGLGSSSAIASDLQHLQASITDSFSSSHGLPASYHSQASSRSLSISTWAVREDVKPVRIGISGVGSITDGCA